jgi:hypothetical protein
VGGLRLRRPLGCRSGLPAGHARRHRSGAARRGHARPLHGLGDAPDPDLLIRTGGELRISNFLLWQLAYSELVFTDCLWPDFGETDLDAAISAFAARDRRFGLVKAAPVQATGT